MHFKKKNYDHFLSASFVAVLTACAFTPVIAVAVSRVLVPEASLYNQYTDGTSESLNHDYVDEETQAEWAAKKEAERVAAEEAQRKAEEEAAQAAQQSSYDESYYDESYYDDSYDGYDDSYDSGYSGGYSSGGNGVLTAAGGVNYYNGNMETWYSQRVLPGGGLNIPGRHVAEDGTVRDGDGNIVVASDNYGYGEIVETSLGTGKVYDTGVGHDGWDIYVDW